VLDPGLHPFLEGIIPFSLFSICAAPQRPAAEEIRISVFSNAQARSPGIRKRSFVYYLIPAVPHFLSVCVCGYGCPALG